MRWRVPERGDTPRSGQGGEGGRKNNFNYILDVKDKRRGGGGGGDSNSLTLFFCHK